MPESLGLYGESSGGGGAVSLSGHRWAVECYVFGLVGKLEPGCRSRERIGNIKATAQVISCHSIWLAGMARVPSSAQPSGGITASPGRSNQDDKNHRKLSTFSDNLTAA